MGDFEVQRDVALAPLTTIRLGGFAQYFVDCTSREEVREALVYAATEGYKVHILGGGSNTIFSDDGFAGLVLRVNLKGIEFAVTDDMVSARVAAGEDWDEFVKQCVEKNYAGVEALSGIPGLVGATPMQNVGAYGQEVADTILSVEAIDRETLELVSFSNEECDFQYRGSRFKYADKGRYVILEVTYRLRVGGASTVRYEQLAQLVTPDSSLQKVREAVLTLRKGKSMVIDENDPNSRSCGSFFLNPILSSAQLKVLRERVGSDVPSFEADGGTKVSAGWLMEQAGFRKGDERNGVGISENHVLALVNRGGTVKDLMVLAAEIQETVKRDLGIDLVREPVVV